jgi:hypothetical protein
MSKFSLAPPNEQGGKPAQTGVLFVPAWANIAALKK